MAQSYKESNTAVSVLLQAEFPITCAATNICKYAHCEEILACTAHTLSPVWLFAVFVQALAPLLLQLLLPSPTALNARYQLAMRSMQQVAWCTPRKLQPNSHQLNATTQVTGWHCGFGCTPPCLYISMLLCSLCHYCTVSCSDCGGRHVCHLRACYANTEQCMVLGMCSMLISERQQSSVIDCDAVNRPGCGLHVWC